MLIFFLEERLFLKSINYHFLLRYLILNVSLINFKNTNQCFKTIPSISEMILRNIVSISEKDGEYIAITHTKIPLKRTSNNPHSLTLIFFNTNKNQIILALWMEISANEIQQKVRYWGSLRKISVTNTVCLQSDYIKGLVCCMYAFLSFTIMRCIRVFSKVTQLHIGKQASIYYHLSLNFFNRICFTKFGKEQHAKQKQEAYLSSILVVKKIVKKIHCLLILCILKQD